MKKLSVLLASVNCLLLLPLLAVAEPYLSLNEICVVEKKGNGYWFLNEQEGAAKANQMFGEQRNQFEWFFAENGEIVAKVYPALRDAIIATPDDLYKQRIHACALTRKNQQLAANVSFKYKSKDDVCACLVEKGGISIVSAKELAKIPYEQLALFFETGGIPSVIKGIVPPVLSKVWIDLPDDYIQPITPCANNTSNEEMIEQLETQVHNLRRR